MVAAHKSLLAILAGAWNLVNRTSLLPDGSVSPANDTSLGPNATGIIIYTNTGWMSMSSMSTKPEWRPQSLTWTPQSNQSDADWALVGKHTYSYAGPVTSVVELTPTSGTLVHGPLTYADIPAQVGTEQHREYALSDNATLLRLSTSTSSGGTAVLFWRRLGIYSP